VSIPDIPINPTANESFAVDISGVTAGLDMTTVTAVSFKVKKPNRMDELNWTASIVSASSTSLRARHTFSGGEFDVVGTYRIVPILTVAGQQKRGKPTYLEGTFY